MATITMAIQAQRIQPRTLSAASPPLQQRAMMEHLVQSYLVHHGYSHAAAALTDQIKREAHEVTQGLGTALGSSLGLLNIFPAPRTSHRLRIRQAVLQGDPDLALMMTLESFPSVLHDVGEVQGGFLFKLRLRSFIEHASHLGQEKLSGINIVKSKEISMQLDEDPPRDGDAGMDALLAQGKALHEVYGMDARGDVQSRLRLAFSLLAYDLPENATVELRDLLSHQAREVLAEELSSAILGELTTLMYLVGPATDALGSLGIATRQAGA